MKRLALLPTLALMFLAGCSSAPRIQTPDGFAELDGGEHYAFRATNASGVVVGIRAEDNEMRGNLEFWTQALANKLEKSGYARVGAFKVTTRTGLEGRRLRYEIERNERKQEYWLTVFVTDSRVVVIEAGGDEAFFDDKTEKEVDGAIATLAL